VWTLNLNPSTTDTKKSEIVPKCTESCGIMEGRGKRLRESNGRVKLIKVQYIHR
jgi:hypothetical protein